MGTDSEDFPLFSRNEPLHRLLDVLSVSDEEDEPPIQFLLSMGMILDEEPAGYLLCGFAFAFDRPTKSFASSCNACSSS